MCFLFSFQFVDCFHFCNLVYNSWEFILAMLRLLFHTFIKFSSKVAWNLSRWCSMWWVVLPRPLTIRQILPDCETDGYLAFVCNLTPFFPLWKCSLHRFLTPFPMVRCPDNPTMHLTLIHFAPFRILAPWLSLIENITWSRLCRRTRDPSLIT